MSLEFEVFYHPDVEKRDFPKISFEIIKRIIRAIDVKLTSSPQDFGEPLRRTLKGYWKLRVGDYRVIYKVEGKAVTVLRIGHRREIYDK